jgi:hypothetical protein
VRACAACPPAEASRRAVAAPATEHRRAGASEAGADC